MSNIEGRTGHVLGCDMGTGPTFSVYLDGETIATYPTEIEAIKHYNSIYECGLQVAKARGLLTQLSMA